MAEAAGMAASARWDPSDAAFTVEVPVAERRDLSEIRREVRELVTTHMQQQPYQPRISELSSFLEQSMLDFFVKTPLVDRPHGDIRAPRPQALEEIERLLTALHCDPVVILGYSTGGYAGLSFALKHPGRVVGLWMHGTKFYLENLP
jgi:predicted esterase